MEKLHSEMYFQTAMSDMELLKCYRLRYKVYCEEKRWISPQDYPNRLEKDLYDEKAVHVMAYDSEFELVGLMRILLKREYDVLPFQEHPGLKGKNLMANNVAELSRFMVTAKANRMELTRGLLRAVYQKSIELGVENWVIINEPSLIRLLAIMGFVFEPICQPTKYFGGFTQVALGNVARSEEMWKNQKPEFAEFYQGESVFASNAMAG